MQVIEVKPENILETVNSLKKEFDMLISVLGTDMQEYYEIVYHLLSTSSSKKLMLKAKLNKNNPEIDSLSEIYSAANWHERETYDLLGINFKNHPEMERILLPIDWKGHPLRKNYINNDERLCWNER
ncbi:MAG: hypothetical protein A2Y25_03910 [Candidatus Melainabacteria bacterium GWF2_37_15]|nr:MAG: hypothetical protein A2Y25_03910 [Candidatus Melainabacteria bacterium GWF2_37_15]